MNQQKYYLKKPYIRENVKSVFKTFDIVCAKQRFWKVTFLMNKNLNDYSTYKKNYINSLGPNIIRAIHSIIVKPKFVEYRKLHRRVEGEARASTTFIIRLFYWKTSSRQM